MRIGINCGHTISGTPGSGATGYLNESNETRAVGYKLMELLKQKGHTVIDCTDNESPSASANLKNICALANAQPLDMFLSIHFNAGGGMGTEVFTYGSGDVACAGKMKSALYKLGFKDRGIKDGSNLYVIKNTKAPAALIEVCFVDTKTDAELYARLGAEKVAEALAEAISEEKSDTKKNEANDLTELKAELDALTETVKILATELHDVKNPMIYNYIDENMPEWARDSVRKAVEKGIIKGEENGLNLTYSDLRSIVREDRAGLFD